jgi:hypothetical protein
LHFASQLETSSLELGVFPTEPPGVIIIVFNGEVGRIRNRVKIGEEAKGAGKKNRNWKGQRAGALIYRQSNGAVEDSNCPPKALFLRSPFSHASQRTSVSIVDCYATVRRFQIESGVSFRQTQLHIRSDNEIEKETVVLEYFLSPCRVIGSTFCLVRTLQVPDRGTDMSPFAGSKVACIELSGFIVEKVDPLLFGYPLFISHIVHEDDESSLHRPLPSFSGCKLLVGCFGPLEALSAPVSNPNGTLIGKQLHLSILAYIF